MSINGKGLSSHAKKKETVNGLWSNALEATQRLLDLFGTHPLEEGKAQFPLPFSYPSKEIQNASRLLLGQTTWSDGLNDRTRSCLKEIFPIRESGLQPLIGPIPISVVRVL